MTVSIIAAIIGITAFAVMGLLVAKHWKEIRMLNPMSLKEEQTKKQREQMIMRRFERLSADRLEGIKRFGRQFGRQATQSYRKIYRKLKRVEHAYKKTSNPLSTMGPSTEDRIKNLLGEARGFARDLKWADAERRYLEVLTLDKRNIDGFRGLGQIYLKQRLFPQAKETFEYLQKIGKADDTVYAGLAEIALANENIALAERMRMKAVSESPKQAHRHAELAEFYLEQDEPEKAWPEAKTASELEPGSAKYLELSLETAILLGDRNEAKERFQKLRLLIEDQSRFQSWKKKIDELEA